MPKNQSLVLAFQSMANNRKPQSKQTQNAVIRAQLTNAINKPSGSKKR